MNPAEFANIAQAESGFWWYRGMRRILYALLDPLARARRFERVLEAGCGTGYMARALEQRYGWRIVPVDLGWEGLAFAHRMSVQRLAQCDIAALPFAGAAFDAVLSLDVLIHFPRGGERDALREMARVLAPGGLLILRVAAFDCLRSRHSEFVQERQRFTRGQVVRLAEGNGLRVIRATYANALLAPVAWAKFRLWEPLAGQPPASGVTPAPAWLDRALYAPLAAEAAWIGAGLSFPAGQSLLFVGEKRAR